MIKVTTRNPKDVKILRDFCEQNLNKTYESDIFFKDRFMVDHELSGMCWCIVPKKQYIRHEDIIPQGDQDNAPIRIMAIDIEAIPKDNGGLPTSDEDPIVLISLAFDPPWRGHENVVMVAKNIKCPRSDVLQSEGEAAMLSKLGFIFDEYDPTIIGGYNSNGFDIPYITDRAKRLGVPLSMSRDGKSAWCKSYMGKSTVQLNGRISLDMLPAVKALDKYRLKSYRLANVAKEILGIEKLDVKPSEMKELWTGPDINRFISYSRRDALLVLELIKKTGVLEKYIALSKASGAFLQVVVNGGQSSMIEAKLIREYNREGYVMGTKSALEDDDIAQVEGAIVLDPVLGLTENVVILDFKSLYPTTMIAHNLCYTTEIREECPDCNLIASPSGGKFVPPDVRRGIVPRVLEKLLDERIKAKKAMKNPAISEGEKRRLDAKQYAMKILLNSFYGYSGYARARLYSPVIANSVTSYGRENLLKTKHMIEQKEYIEINDSQYKLKVIAGDTDSTFINICGEYVDFDIAKKIGIEIADMVTSKLPPPMELVFEAYAKRILILAKKHYAMYRFESADKGEIKAKGIETVRRDWCNLTSEVLTKCLETILIEGDVDAALSYARESINLLKASSSDMFEKLTMTRTLTKKPENYNQPQPHSELVKKLERRGIFKYAIGDRIPFIIVASQRRSGRRAEMMTLRAEDPEYAIENNLRIDADYYLSKQLIPPLVRMFENFGIHELDLLQPSRQQTFDKFEIGGQPQINKRCIV
jgi:DNA polymerase I